MSPKQGPKEHRPPAPTPEERAATRQERAARRAVPGGATEWRRDPHDLGDPLFSRSQQPSEKDPHDPGFYKR
jgi:hypothetical protein